MVESVDAAEDLDNLQLVQNGRVQATFALKHLLGRLFSSPNVSRFDSCLIQCTDHALTPQLDRRLLGSSFFSALLVICMYKTPSSWRTWDIFS